MLRRTLVSKPGLLLLLCCSLAAQSCLTLGIPWTVARQAPLSMGFLRQECWRGLPGPSPRDNPHPGMEAGSPALQVDSLSTESPGKLFHIKSSCLRI